jgi:RNA polymerase sigma-70 factor (ECF subfamily)
MTQKLIRRALSGDETGLETLFRQHYPPTLRLALGLLGDEQDAEEVAQDSLLYALTHLDRYDPARATFSTWLYTITVSRCRSRRRRKWWPTVQLAAWLERGDADREVEPARSSGPEERVERNERDAALWAAVMQLSPKQREAIVLRYAADLTYPQMAEVLGCSTSAAQSRTWLGEQKLRDLLFNLAPGMAAGSGAQDERQWEMSK